MYQINIACIQTPSTVMFMFLYHYIVYLCTTTLFTCVPLHCLLVCRDSDHKSTDNGEATSGSVQAFQTCCRERRTCRGNVCWCLPFCMHVLFVRDLFVRGWLIHCSSAALIKSVCHILSAISFSILLNTLEIAN